MLEDRKKFSIITNYPIILASKSIIRKVILKKVGIKFKCVNSNLDESNTKNKLKGKKFNELCKKLAQEKALKVSYKYNNSYIIGADQVCVFGGKIINKPLSKRRAIDQLLMLEGKEHKQISSCCVCFNGKILGSFNETSILKMRKLSRKDITNYVAADSPLQSCGSYKFEARGYLLFSKIKGNHFTIQGMPLVSLLNFFLEKKIVSYG